MGSARQGLRLVVALATVVATSILAVPSSRAAGTPAFEADISNDFADGCDFAPNAAVTVTAKDSPAGSQLYSGDTPTDGEGCFFQDLGEVNVDLAAGMFVSVTDGVATKELTLAPVTVDVVDPAGDTATGTAPPNTDVDVSADTGDDFTQFTVVSNGAGAWTADFGAVPFDITPFSSAHAGVADGDGDVTMASRSPATIAATLPGFLEGCGFVSNGTVTVTLRSSPSGSQLFSGPAETDDDGCFFMDRSQFGQFLAAGMFVSATDGTRTKELTLEPVTVGLIDAVAETAAGTAPPNRDLDVGAEGPAGDVAIPVTSDGGGAWSADFSGQFDLTGGVLVTAGLLDADGDRTEAMRPVPSLNVDLSAGTLGGSGFEVNSSVTVTIKDAPGGSVLFTGDFPTAGAAGFFGNGGFFVQPLQTGQGLSSGRFVSVTDGTLTHQLTIDPLAITAVDPGADKVTGTAAPGSQVHVHADSPTGSGDRFVTAGGTGVWTAKFAGFIDIVNGWPASAELHDVDGDAALVAGFAPSVDANLTTDGVHACGFPPGAPVTVTIRTSSGGTVLFNAASPADGFGCVEVPRSTHGQDLVPGRFVRATDGTISRSETLAALAMTTFDFPGGLVSGTAPPGADVLAGFSLPERGDGRETTADGGGAWTVDFEQPIPPGGDYTATVLDVAGNATVVGRPPTAIEANLATDVVDGCGFTPSGSATATIKASPSGSTLFTGSTPIDTGGCLRLTPAAHGRDLVAGMFVHVEQGQLFADHRLVDIAIGGLDSANDRVTGTAPPSGPPFGVHVEPGAGGAGADLAVTANDLGEWSANFGPGFDVTSSTRAVVSITDDEFDADLTVTEVAAPPCFLDGTTLRVAAGSFTLHRLGSAFDVTGTGITDPTCGGATMSNVDTVQVGGDAGAQTLTVDLTGGQLGPGATAEGSGTSEIEIVAALGPEDSLVVKGSAGNDAVVVGTAGINLNGDNDADLTRATPGVIQHVTVNGGAGADQLSATGGPGTGSAYPLPITLNGGADADTLLGGQAGDVLNGGDAEDDLTGGGGANTLTGGGGSDRVLETADASFFLNPAFLGFGPSSDALSGVERAALTGGPSANTMNASAFTGPVTLEGQAGNDNLVGGPAADTLKGGDGNDTLTGAGGSNVVQGGAGSDLLSESGNVNFMITNATLTFGGASDALFGIERAGLAGGPGANVMDGSAFGGVLTLDGQGGNDTLTGGPANDVLSGGGDADVLLGRQGVNTLNGGAASDTVRYDWAPGGVRVNLGGGTASGPGFSDLVIAVENAVGSSFADVLTAGAGQNALRAGPGNDTVDVRDGVRGNDVADGGGGTDRCLTDQFDARQGCETS